MLLTKSVIVRWECKTKKWYESKGYIFTKWKDKFEINVEDLPLRSHENVDVQCDKCGEILSNFKWYNYAKNVKEDGKYYCKKCANLLYGYISEDYRKTRVSNSISFYDWCYANLSKELADIIMLRWDYRLNIKNGKILSPKDVTYRSGGFNRKGYWFKCLDRPEHESELKSISKFTSGIGNIDCNQCNTIVITHPELVKYLVNKDDALKSYGSNKKVPMKCPDCEFEKPMRINTLVNYGFGCPRCGDGVSYPNKFIFNFLEQIIKLEKIKEFKTEKIFNWLVYEFKHKLRKGKLDCYFEVNSSAYVIEMDGGWHKKDNAISGQTKEESKFIDDEKDRLCKEHDIEVIRIDCGESKLELIKNNIMKSNLPQILNFDEEDIDWLKCHEFACNSLVKIACDLWNNEIKSTVQIAELLRLHSSTIRKYLKQGTELEWCDYNAQKEFKNRIIYAQKVCSKKVICLNTKETFNSLREAQDKYNISGCGVSACCNNRQKTAGKHPITGEQLKWIYYDQYIQLFPEEEVILV